MTPWQEFYQSIKDPIWPKCEKEKDFVNLPKYIQQECFAHGYVLGEYASHSALAQRVFPIKSATACQLKWNWSTVYLSTEKTASCHRTHYHEFDTETFNFHNTARKIVDRERMLQGLWPENGCEYCRNIEEAGGQSDRMTNADFPGIHAPFELSTNPIATTVTPRILEVYLDNTCNLKCVYCNSNFSSLWEAENRKFGPILVEGQTLFDKFDKSTNIESNRKKLFKWIRKHGQHLTNLNILGGEPLYQKELDDCLDLFDDMPCPNLDLQIITNLNVSTDRVHRIIHKMRNMINDGNIKNFTVTASLDCWGAPQEYTRYPLDLALWETNFKVLLAEPWIKLIVGSTITPLTIHTLDQLIERINHWNQTRTIYHYFNSVSAPSYMFIDIFGDLFREDFDRCLAVFNNRPETRRYLQGIADQSCAHGINTKQIRMLKTVLDELDRRRNTDWRQTFPWLVAAVDQ